MIVLRTVDGGVEDDGDEDEAVVTAGSGAVTGAENEEVLSLRCLSQKAAKAGFFLVAS